MMIWYQLLLSNLNLHPLGRNIRIVTSCSAEIKNVFYFPEQKISKRLYFYSANTRRQNPMYYFVCKYTLTELTVKIDILLTYWLINLFSITWSGEFELGMLDLRVNQNKNFKICKCS